MSVITPNWHCMPWSPHTNLPQIRYLISSWGNRQELAACLPLSFLPSPSSLPLSRWLSISLHHTHTQRWRSLHRDTEKQVCHGMESINICDTEHNIGDVTCDTNIGRRRQSVLLADEFIEWVMWLADPPLTAKSSTPGWKPAAGKENSPADTYLKEPPGGGVSMPAGSYLMSGPSLSHPRRSSCRLRRLLWREV